MGNKKNTGGMVNMKKMTAAEHMEKTLPMAIYPGAGQGGVIEVMYLGLGLADEAGEVVGKIKKIFRDNTLDKEAIAKELGDVYWYLAGICNFLGYSPEEVMYMNWEKLASRQERGVLGGSGDNR